MSKHLKLNFSHMEKVKKNSIKRSNAHINENYPRLNLSIVFLIPFSSKKSISFEMKIFQINGILVSVKYVKKSIFK